MSSVRYVDNYVIQNTFSAGDLISLRNVEVYVLARVVILRVDLYSQYIHIHTVRKDLDSHS